MAHRIHILLADDLRLKAAILATLMNLSITGIIHVALYDMLQKYEKDIASVLLSHSTEEELKEIVGNKRTRTGELPRYMKKALKRAEKHKRIKSTSISPTD